VRFDAADMLAASGASFVWYEVGWLANVFLPVAVAVALVRRSLLLALIVLGVAFRMVLGLTWHPDEISSVSQL
jgi:hypothetical protein